jgi:DNA-binding MarR family transcriptional regulator
MTHGELDIFADRVNDAMQDIMKSVIRLQTNAFFKGKITVPQFLALHLLAKKGESRMSDLAHLMGVTTAATTGVVGRLVKCGYVKRIYDPQDRRIIRIQLTVKGAELADKITQERRGMIISLFSQISEKERQEYLKILLHIHEHLPAASGEKLG